MSNLPRAQSETKRIKTTVDDATFAERDEAASEQGKGQTHESKREGGTVCVPDFTPAFQPMSTVHVG